MLSLRQRPAIVNILFISFILALGACIEVDHFNDYWEQSGFDSELIGAWVPLRDDQDGITFSTDEARNMVMTVEDVSDLQLGKDKKKKDTWLNKEQAIKSKAAEKEAAAADEADDKDADEKKDDAKEEMSSKEILYTRSLVRGKNHFLMIKNAPNDEGGTLHFYQIIQQRLVFLTPKASKRKAFLEKYKNSGIEVSKDQVRIHTLDAQTMNVLIAVANDPSYWERANSYRRPDSSK